MAFGNSISSSIDQWTMFRHDSSQSGYARGEVFFIERKRTHSKQIKNPSKLPTAPPLHEEPLRGIEPGKIICEIWKSLYR